MNLAEDFTLSKSGFLFDHSTGLTYTLNPTGKFIFQMISDNKDAAEILTALTGQFMIDSDTAKRDLEDFYRQMREMGMID